MTRKPDLHAGCSEFQLSRRKLLIGSAAGAAYAMLPSTALSSLAGSRDPRFLTIILRGALDGLAIVPPIGDPSYADVRGKFGLSGESVIPLDGLFALNAHMPNLARLFMQKDALIVHAAASPYRNRSHFDGQDVLESGIKHTGGSTGWLNRAVSHLASNQPARPSLAVSMGYTAPLIMRGAAPVMSWAPQVYTQPSSSTLDRILALYDARDPKLAGLLRTGIEMDAGQMPDKNKKRNQAAQFRKEIAQTISFFTDPDGPRIAALSADGWDTHSSQNPVKGRMAGLLKILDEGIASLEKGLKPIWDDTVITIVTEFGRTVNINGTKGTDHGTATAAFLIGGAVKGGRVISDWPGLKQNQLYDGRDLMPTTNINSVFKGVLKDHLGLDDRLLASKVFPDSVDVKPMSGLVT
ncbi:MAG: DUF1501 domain-containing protein [Cohaesibacteraceae bacterium]|nr:DUF1501 domain-containing protein [Cohaesibacteraceae bacterium]